MNIDHRILQTHHLKPIEDVDFELSDVESCGIEGYDIADFSWELTNKCQYRCTYCYAWDYIRSDIGSNHLQSWRAVISKLKLNNCPKFNIELLGGEPTLHPDIVDIISALCDNDRCQRVELITNLVKPVEFFLQFDHPKFSKLQVSVSHHPEYNKNKFTDKCITLSRCNFDLFVNLNVMKDTSHWTDTIKILGQLHSNKLHYDINLLHSTDHYKGFNHSSAGEGDCNDSARYSIDKFKQLASTELRIDVDDLFNTIIERKVTYKTPAGDKVVRELDIRTAGLDKFHEKFSCKAMTWNISHDGAIINACSGEPMDVLMRNSSACITCPVTTGCACDLMFIYPKTKN